MPRDNIKAFDLLDVVAKQGWALTRLGADLDVESVCEQIFEISDGVHRMDAINRERADVAGYLAIVRDDGKAIEAHSESAPLPARPDLAFFICTEASASGGESLVYDGVALASTLSPERLQYLAGLSFVIEGHYEFEQISYMMAGLQNPQLEFLRRTQGPGAVDLNKGVNFSHRTSPLVLDHAGNIAFCSYWTLSRHWPAELRGRLARIPELSSEFWSQGAHVFSLQAGDVLLIDNWRCMHGRMPFQAGNQRSVLAGFSYLSRLQGVPLNSPECSEPPFQVPLWPLLRQ